MVAYSSQIPRALPQLELGKKIGTGKKGVRTQLCAAPEGPSRQLSPDPFFPIPSASGREDKGLV